MKKKRRYEVRLLNSGWTVCKKAQRRPFGCLRFELEDGTVGLARPGAWRELP